MKRSLGVAASALLVLLSASCAPKAPPSKVLPPVKPVYHAYLTIMTGQMTGKPGWPQMQPSDFTLPPDSEVILTITNYDDDDSTVPATYNQVRGTLTGKETVNGQSVSSVDMKKIAHTFSLDALKLNLPIPVAHLTKGPIQPTVVVAEFHTPKAGTQTWQCYASCGSGKSGWEGSMSTDGFMTGKVTFSNQ